jgi:N-hydroxyarylamine O-acetyltransferase
MNIAAYLARIGYAGPVVPNSESLRNLHRAHLLTVPFENLDIAWGREISVDREAFVSKVVKQRRGGFCYELNGAFAALLEALGFQVTLLSARVPRRDGSEGPEFDHLTLRVDLEQAWLADVGFGDSFIDPLRLQTGVEQHQYGQCYRIIEQGEDLRLEKKGAGWDTAYVFTLKPRRLEEFAGMCRYHQTSPESPFTQKRVCSLATPNGRITLWEMKFISTRDGAREESILGSEQEWRAVLNEKFGVCRPQQASALLPSFSSPSAYR